MVVEDGSELAAELWGTRHRAACSVLAYPEGRAALAAAHCGRRLDADGLAQACESFEALQEEVLLVGVDRQLTRHAGELAQEHSLRGYDAVHLAAALALGTETTLITWDRDLALAAASVGLGVAPAAGGRQDV